MHEAYPEMLIAAGTVLTTEQVDRAVAAGAEFIVSPGLNPRIVKYCVERNIPIHQSADFRTKGKVFTGSTDFR